MAPSARLSKVTEITALRFAKAFRSLGITDRSSCSHSALASLAAALAGIPAWAPHISEAMVALPNSLIEIVSELVWWFESIHFNDNSSLSSLASSLAQLPVGSHPGHIASAMLAANQTALSASPAQPPPAPVTPSPI